MPQQIQLRRDSASNWTSNNPTLSEGEIGIELDTDQFKIGDGITAWNSLAYFSSGSADTAAQILAKLLTVDGPGSGLNADLLDGQSSAAFETPSGAQAKVDAAINALINASPATLNTLDELAAALGDDASFAATMTTALAGKQPIDSDLTAIAALTTTAYGRALLTTANLAALQTILGPTGTPSATSFLRGDGTWAIPAGGVGGVSVSSGDGVPASTPASVGDIYVDTTADVVYVATDTVSSADWKQGVAVATSTAGTWEARPQAQIVIWAAGTDTAATTPAAAVGDDLIILAENPNLTSIGANGFPETIVIACSDMTTPITTGTTKAYWVAPWACTLTSVKATLATAGTGITTIDINEGAGAGTTVLSTKLTIDSTETDSSSAAAPAVISDSAIAANDRITIDFDGVGTGALGVLVYLTVVRTL